MSLSPATLQALQDTNIGYASQDFYKAEAAYQNQEGMTLQGLTNATSVGEGAAAGTNAALVGSTNQQISAQGAIGNAQAAGITGQAAAINQGIGGVSGAANQYLTSQYYSNLFGNPSNLGGSTPVASPGGSLQYDQWGNIIGGGP